MISHFKRSFLAFGSGLCLAFAGSPSWALERLVLRMPSLETSISINLGDSHSVEELINGSPDLVELRRVSKGGVQSLLKRLFLAPLPLQTKDFLQAATKQPLLEQALAAATYFVDLKGVKPDTSGRMLTDAMTRAERNGQPNVLGFLRELPGEEASIDVSRVFDAANRLRTNLQEGFSLVAAGQPASVNSVLKKPLSGGWTREVLQLSVPHRTKPMRLISLVPAESNGLLVVITHGLWDEPESFEGWGEVLTEHGYTVLLPEHSGSSYRQQQLMLAGDRPPPGPEELRLRPLDVSELLNAVEQKRLLASHSLDISSVGVVGHSWGATTTLQLAGAVPTDRKLTTRCSDLKNPERNISWVLQCSWLSAIKQAGIADPRVKAVAAVSPPLRLLFDPRVRQLSAKVLLISGSRDWVVPSGPEAIRPMRETGAAELGHRLVLVEGGDHFNLSSARGEAQPALLGPLLLTWMNEQLNFRGSAFFSEAGWGDDRVRMIDVSGQL